MTYELIIGIACFGAVLQELPLWQTILEKAGLDMKPFNCAICFTFWMSLGPLLITNGVMGIFHSITAAVLAELISRQFQKI